MKGSIPRVACALASTALVAVVAAPPPPQDNPDALLRATIAGDLDEVDSLLAAGVDLAQRDRTGSTPLMIAARHGDTEIVEILIDAGADSEATDAGGRSVRDWAAGRDRILEVLESSRRASPPVDGEPGQLIDRSDPDYPLGARTSRIQGQVQLEILISVEGQVDQVQVICGHPMLVDAATDAVRKWKYRPYMLQGEPIPIRTTITTNFSFPGRIPPSAPDDVPCFSIHDAAATDDRDWLRDRIAEGADLDRRDEGGRTALQIAAYFGSEGAARTLLEGGARSYLMSDDGLTALMIAVLREQRNVLRTLLEAGAPLDSAERNGATALLLASQMGDTETVRLLLEHGADPNLAAANGATPLAAAATHGHYDLIGILREAGAVR